MWKRTTDIARERGVSSQAVRNWIRQGKFDRVEELPTGHFRIWVDSPEETVLYARVSSAKQRGSLDTQRRILEQHHSQASFVSDIGSGFNFKRRGFVSLLERAMLGGAIKVVVTTQDRLCRVGFPLIQRLFKLSGGSIECLEENDNAEQFDIGTLTAFLTSFCNSQSGKRSSRRNKKDQNLSEGQTGC